MTLYRIVHAFKCMTGGGMMDTIESLQKALASKDAVIQMLLRQNVELKKAVENLDKLVAMYDRLSRAEALELAAADDTINAQETVQEATRKELEGVWNTVRAHEEVELFASQEVRLLREQLEDEQSADRKRTDHGTE